MNHLIDLEQTLHQRFGVQAFRPLADTISSAEVEVIPTGFPALDSALHLGGLPLGHATTLVGTSTSGITTLALQAMTQCQEQRGYCAYVDVEGVVAPDIALGYGINLEALLLVQPEDSSQALNIVRDLAATGDMSLIVLDWIGQSGKIPLHRLTGLLGRSHTALVVLTESPAKITGTDSLRLQVRVVDWLYAFGDVVGYRSEVTILRNKLAPRHEPVCIEVVIEAL
jgi:recombination protein RecA